MSVYNAYLALSGTAGIVATMDERLSYRTSYRIGGAAKLMCVLRSYSALTKAIETLQQEHVNWVLLGRGSNVLVSDEGFSGCVLKLDGEFSKIHIDEDTASLSAGAGVLLSKAVATTCARGLEGLEHYVGIPGTIGGAISTNCGSRHNWIGSCVSSLVCYFPDRGLVRLEKEELDFSYRYLALPKDAIILEATFELKKWPKDRLKEDLELRQKRFAKNMPLGQASCGAIFKDTADKSADELIRACGLVGRRIGGASISEVNANVIVNDRRASAMDVIGLIHLAHDEVEKQFGIQLRPEVKFLGFGA